jgi:hypothetical protein
MKYTCEEVEFMIEEFCKDQPGVIIYRDVIELISKEFNCDALEILKTKNSRYIENYVGTLDGNSIGRITNRNQYIKTIKKAVKMAEKNLKMKLTPREKINFVEELECALTEQYK